MKYAPQWRTCVLSLWCFSLGNVLSADDGFLLFPVTTDLQRALLSPHEDASAYLAIYGNGVIANGRADLASLNIDELRTGLKPLAVPGEGAIYVSIRYENWTPQPKAEKELQQAIERVCQEAGFERKWIGQTYAHGGWHEVNRAVERNSDAPGAEEGHLGDWHVRVYPVSTGLSRYLTNDADCCVEIRQPLDGRQADLSPFVRQTISQFVDKLALDKRERIQFHVSSTEAGQPDVVRFSAIIAAQFARQIGFESATVRQTLIGGAPESLLGKAPPEFMLYGLDGEPISLEDEIRGRVAIITFWGLACGPCRQEAPYLSAAFEAYKDKGLSVIAVNAFNDDRAAVADYVQKEQLRHSIALKGQRVARDYAIGAFPTSFWVDHRGRVVDYVVGFDPGDESQITLRIEQLLQERNASPR